MPAVRHISDMAKLLFVGSAALAQALRMSIENAILHTFYELSMGILKVTFQVAFQPLRGVGRTRVAI